MRLNQRICFLPQEKIQHQLPQPPSLLSHILAEKSSRIIRSRDRIRRIRAAGEFVDDAVFDTGNLYTPSSTNPYPSNDPNFRYQNPS